MLQRLTIALTALCFCLTLQAQQPGKQPKGPRFSKEEFRVRQEAYLTEKAELTKEEAAQFFPVYFELQDKKQALNHEGWQRMRKGKDPNTTEAEYEKMVEDILKTRIETDKLDLEYLARFKKILSAKKIYKLQHAEMKFSRDILKIMHRPKGERK